jgi:hypothetical protein
MKQGQYPAAERLASPGKNRYIFDAKAATTRRPALPGYVTLNAHGAGIFTWRLNADRY